MSNAVEASGRCFIVSPVLTSLLLALSRHGQGNVRVIARARHFLPNFTRKYYELLDVPQDATEADLKKAYRKKCAFDAYARLGAHATCVQSLTLAPRQGWRSRAVQGSHTCVRASLLWRPRNPLTGAPQVRSPLRPTKAQRLRRTGRGRAERVGRHGWHGSSGAFLPIYQLFFV